MGVPVLLSAPELVPAVESVESRGPFPWSIVSLGVVPVVGKVVSDGVVAGIVVGAVEGVVSGAMVGLVVSMGSLSRQPASREMQSSRLSARKKNFFIFLTSV